MYNILLWYVNSSEEVQIVSHNSVYFILFLLYMFWLYWKAIIRQLKKYTKKDNLV
jgi:hypothetical protein